MSKETYNSNDEELPACNRDSLSPGTFLNRLEQGIKELKESLTNYFDYEGTYVLAAYIGGYFAKALQYELKDKDCWVKSDNSPVTIIDAAVQIIVMQIFHLICLEHEYVRMICEENIRIESFPIEHLEKVVELLNEFLPLSFLKKHFGCSNEKEPEVWITSDILDKDMFCKIFDHGGSEPIYKPSQRLMDSHYIILDPIDGTKGYIRREHFAVGICAVDCRSGKIDFACIVCPNLSFQSIDELRLIPGHDNMFEIPINSLEDSGKIYVASLNKGALVVKDVHSGPENAKPVRLPISSALEHSSKAYIVQSKSTKPLELQAMNDCLVAINKQNDSVICCLDSMAKFCLVAEGYADLYIRFSRSGCDEMVWDILPGKLIIEEAKGKISHLDGEDIKYSGEEYLSNMTGVISCNSTAIDLQEGVLEYMRKK